MSSMPYDFWQPMNEFDEDSFIDTRNQLHQAVQNVAAVGRIFLPDSQIDENATLTWVPSSRRLAGKWIQGEIKFRSSIGIEDFVVYLVDSAQTVLSSLSLENKKQGSIMVWLEEQLALLGVESSHITLNYPYDLPEYPQAKGKPFTPNKESAKAITNLYHNAWLGLSQFITIIGGFKELKTWPHHFDMASLQIVKDTGDLETSASIGIGLSPGDHMINEPYFYVNSWPYAQQESFPVLSHGNWYEENWAGSVLKYSEIVRESSAIGQHRILLNFLESSYHPLRSTIK